MSLEEEPFRLLCSLCPWLIVRMKPCNSVPAEIRIKFLPWFLVSFLEAISIFLTVISNTQIAARSTVLKIKHLFKTQKITFKGLKLLQPNLLFSVPDVRKISRKRNKRLIWLSLSLQYNKVISRGPMVTYLQTEIISFFGKSELAEDSHPRSPPTSTNQSLSNK